MNNIFAPVRIRAALLTCDQLSNIANGAHQMDLLMVRQREKVGQEAFLRAVTRGERGEDRKPFHLNQVG